MAFFFVVHNQIFCWYTFVSPAINHQKGVLGLYHYTLKNSKILPFEKKVVPLQIVLKQECAENPLKSRPINILYSKR